MRMLRKETIEGVRIVLVRPQGAMNIGAVARVMKNFGLSELALVAPAVPPLHKDALMMAVHARDVLEHALVFTQLADAIAECTWVCGTTKRMGKRRRNVIDPTQMSLELKELVAQNKIAILFGSEDRGLTNRDLDLCQRLVVIPADKEYGSLNLAQAVAIICYELYKAWFLPVVSQKRRLATSEELEGMYGHLEQLLLSIGFLDENNPKRMMTVLRQIFSRAKLDPREVKIVRGICRQALWFVSKVSK